MENAMRLVLKIHIKRTAHPAMIVERIVENV
jgi:hypothetical protein